MIVLVIVHFINNWFMMILVAVYVYLKINAMKSPLSSVPVGGGSTGVHTRATSFTLGSKMSNHNYADNAQILILLTPQR